MIIRIYVKVKTGASREKMEWADPLTARVWVRERPIEGKANEAVRRILADHFKVGVSRVSLVRGAAAKIKLWDIETKTDQS